MAINFGVANDFNIFVLENHTASNTDAEGRVAVGGTAMYTNYGVGDKLTISTTRPDLVVGKSINISGGTNFSGNTVIAPGGEVVQYTMTNNNGVPNEPLVEAPVDFGTAAGYLRCVSLNWGALAANGTAVVENGGLTLTGTNPTLNIFSFNGANIAGSGLALGSLNQINIVAPAGATILVNVSGGNLNFGSFQIFRNGTAATGDDGRYILWNLPEASSLMPNTTSIKGSLLAPNADYIAGYSNVEGTIIVKNLNGFVEAHNYLFSGILPDVCPSPYSTSTTTTSTTTSTTTTSTTTISATTTATSTGTTTSTTTTASATSTASTTASAPCIYQQTAVDILESLALVQAGLSHILNAEGEKIQRAVAMDSSVESLLSINSSVEAMVRAVTMLETVLLSKAEQVKDLAECKVKQG